MSDIQLSSMGLLSVLPEATVTLLEASSSARTFGRGKAIFREGDPASELFVIRAGLVAIVNRSPGGRESLVARLEAGTLFGEMPLFDGLPRSADARALEETELTVLPYDRLRDVFDKEPRLLWEMLALLAGRLRAADEALADAAFLDVAGRTAKRLLDAAGRDTTFSLGVTQDQLASMVGASRERVNRALATFVRLGWIESLDRGRYRMLDREALEQRARS